MTTSAEGETSGSSGKWHDLEVDKLFRALVKVQGSDLHMKVGIPPHVRVAGALRPLSRGPIDDAEMTRMLFEMIDSEPRLKQRRREIFDRDGGVDFAHKLEVDGIIWRFRVNILQQMGSMGLVARRVNNKIPDFAGLHLPPILGELCKFDQG